MTSPSLPFPRRPGDEQDDDSATRMHAGREPGDDGGPRPLPARRREGQIAPKDDGADEERRDREHDQQ